jgi:hypothetical protein
VRRESAVQGARVREAQDREARKGRRTGGASGGLAGSVIGCPRDIVCLSQRLSQGVCTRVYVQTRARSVR